MAVKGRKGPVLLDPVLKPHCPFHDVPLVMTMVMPTRRMVGKCPLDLDSLEYVANGNEKGHSVFRNQWVNK